jgi:hypothetical protein
MEGSILNMYLFPETKLFRNQTVHNLPKYSGENNLMVK